MFFQKATPPVNKIGTVPAPIGGLNARDSLANMPETDAVVLNNWWPQPYGCIVRKGYQKWASGLPGAAHTLAAWAGTDGTEKLLAWSVGGFYDVSVQGPVGAPLLTGLSNSYWPHVGYTNNAGSNLVAVNGVDDGILYNATGVHRLISGDGIVDYTWKGLDPKKATTVASHNHRLWVTEKGTALGWYLPTDVLWGELKSFDFGPLLFKGGYLEFIATWTLDDGNGAEDHLVAVSNTGLACVYGGSDPEVETAWSLVGVYNIGAPVNGRRSFAKVGGDLFVLTQQGIVSMTNMLVSTKVKDKQQGFVSDKIQFLISDYTTIWKDEVDWQLSYVPKINMLIVNVPKGPNVLNTQLVCNQITTSWASFENMDAANWTTYNNQPYFGDYGGDIWVAWTGGMDQVAIDGTGGNSVNAQAQQAYSYLQHPGIQKQVSMFRPNFILAGHVNYNAAIEYDFKPTGVETPGGITGSPGAKWNSAVWGVDLWYGSGEGQRIWSQASGLGVAAAIAINLVASDECLWVSTDYSFISGGLL